MPEGFCARPSFLLLHAYDFARERAHEFSSGNTFESGTRQRDSLGEAAAAAADTHMDAIAAASKSRAAARRARQGGATHEKSSATGGADRDPRETGRIRRRAPLTTRREYTTDPTEARAGKRGSRVQGHVRRVRRVMPSVSSVGVLVAVVYS